MEFLVTPRVKSAKRVIKQYPDYIVHAENEDRARELAHRALTNEADTAWTARDDRTLQYVIVPIGPSTRQRDSVEHRD